MFYEVEAKNKGPVCALVCLSPSESKRLIAKGVAAAPEVKYALKNGTVVISRGVTNGYIAEELTGQKIDPKWTSAAGIVANGLITVVKKEYRRKPVVLRKGQITDEQPVEVLEDFDPRDVFIKGVNAIDAGGDCGVMVSSRNGGTIGEALAITQASASILLAPVGLEKLVPSVAESARNLGVERFKYVTGDAVGMIRLPNALVFTEIEALKVLFGVNAVMAAGGGNSGSEGAVILSISGTEAATDAAIALLKSIRGEPPVVMPE